MTNYIHSNLNFACHFVYESLSSFWIFHQHEVAVRHYVHQHTKKHLHTKHGWNSFVIANPSTFPSLFFAHAERMVPVPATLSAERPFFIYAHIEKGLLPTGVNLFQLEALRAFLDTLAEDLVGILLVCIDPCSKRFFLDVPLDPARVEPLL